jgi:hypothetical protein
MAMAEPTVSTGNGAGKRRRDRREPAVAVPGVVSLMEIYTIEEAKLRLRWSDSALRMAKRRGLRLLVCGKRRYLTGREILRFLQSQQSQPSK